MTRKNVPRTCDLCGKDILSEQQYKMQFSLRGGKRGEFTKGADGDCCHPCFLNVCANGYKPNWIQMYKDPQSDKWVPKPSTYDAPSNTTEGKLKVAV